MRGATSELRTAYMKFAYGRMLRVGGALLVGAELEAARRFFVLLAQYSDGGESLPLVARVLAGASPWTVVAIGLFGAVCLGYRKRSADNGWENYALLVALVIIPASIAALYLLARGYW